MGLKSHSSGWEINELGVCNFRCSEERDKKCEDCTNWENARDQEEIGSLLLPVVISGAAAVVASPSASTCSGGSDSGEKKTIQ